MIINETYDTIINKLDTYGINQKKNNYHDLLIDESQEIIYSLYESYIEESKNNKAFSTEWKNLKSEFFKSFKQARKLAKEGNYKSAIQKIDECEKNLLDGFNQLSNNTKFNTVDNLLAMLKYFIIPIILLMASEIFMQLAEHKMKKMVDSGKYSRQDAVYRNIFKLSPEVSERLTTYMFNNDIDNDKTIRTLFKLSRNLDGFGVGLGLSKAIVYTITLLQDLRNFDSEEIQKSINVNYASAKSLVDLMISTLSRFRTQYQNKMKIEE